MGCRGAAAPFGVAPATAIRWQAQRRATGHFARKPQRGDMQSRRAKHRAEDILAVWDARKDISLEELRLALIEVGLTISVAGRCRVIRGRNTTAPLPSRPARLQLFLPRPIPRTATELVMVPSSFSDGSPRRP